MKSLDHCPSCHSSAINVFYELQDVPVHSMLLFETREKALNYPKGNIRLGFCQECGFIFNTEFAPELHEYSSQYEATQTFSPTFNQFAKKLAMDLIERYDLTGKKIIEIGCGNGEFLSLLCKLANSQGIGFDPAFQEARHRQENSNGNGNGYGYSAHHGNNGHGFSSDHDNGNGHSNGNGLTFIKDFYSEKYAHHTADFICCKMTLEHIPDTYNFVSTIRRSLGERNATVFFQIPEARRILREVAFWDIYYEHCSYFSPYSLSSLFKKCGFGVMDVWTEYDRQYLMITAHLNGNKMSLAEEDDLKALADEVTRFQHAYPERLAIWQHMLHKMKERSQRVVLWGSGSKGVAFLTTLKIRDDIEYVVDINPYRQNHYMAGTGQKIVAPCFLKEYRPDVVVVMNPIYQPEIRKTLQKLDLHPEILTV